MIEVKLQLISHDGNSYFTQPDVHGLENVIPFPDVPPVKIVGKVDVCYTLYNGLRMQLFYFHTDEEPPVWHGFTPKLRDGEWHYFVNIPVPYTGEIYAMRGRLPYLFIFKEGQLVKLRRLIPRIRA